MCPSLFFAALKSSFDRQALNLFDTQWKAINEDTNYAVGSDIQLQEALNQGIRWLQFKLKKAKAC